MRVRKRKVLVVCADKKMNPTLLTSFSKLMYATTQMILLNKIRTETQSMQNITAHDQILIPEFSDLKP